MGRPVRARVVSAQPPVLRAQPCPAGGKAFGKPRMAVLAEGPCVRREGKSRAHNGGGGSSLVEGARGRCLLLQVGVCGGSGTLAEPPPTTAASHGPWYKQSLDISVYEVQTWALPKAATPACPSCATVMLSFLLMSHDVLLKSGHFRWSSLATPDYGQPVPPWACCSCCFVNSSVQWLVRTRSVTFAPPQQLLMSPLSTSPHAGSHI